MRDGETCDLNQTVGSMMVRLWFLGGGTGGGAYIFSTTQRRKGEKQRFLWGCGFVHGCKNNNGYVLENLTVGT